MPGKTIVQLPVVEAANWTAPLVRPAKLIVPVAVPGVPIINMDVVVGWPPIPIAPVVEYGQTLNIGNVPVALNAMNGEVAGVSEAMTDNIATGEVEPIPTFPVLCTLNILAFPEDVAMVNKSVAEPAIPVITSLADGDDELIPTLPIGIILNIAVVEELNEMNGNVGAVPEAITVRSAVGDDEPIPRLPFELNVRSLCFDEEEISKSSTPDVTP